MTGPASGDPGTPGEATPGAPPPPVEAVIAEERPHPLTPVVQVWIWLVAVVIFGGRQLLENPGSLHDLDLSRLSWPLLAVAGVGLASLAWNLWAWWTTRFVVTDSELRIDHRGVLHESQRVAYKRVQAVDVSQPFAARLLGLAELTVDVGGDARVRLRYLSLRRASQLWTFLLERASPARRTVAVAASGALPHDGAAPPQPSGATPTGRTLLRVAPAQLALGAALSHELLALLLAGLVPLAIGLVLRQPVLIGGGAVPILLSIAGFLSSRVVGEFGFTVVDTPTGLRITRGLTARTSQSVPVHRVQAIRVDEPVLWRRLRRARVELMVLGSGHGEEDSGARTTIVMLPIGGPTEVNTALRAVWPGLDLADIDPRRGPRRARWLAPLSWPFLSSGWDDRVLLLRSGWWTRRTWIVPHARLQSTVCFAGPLERRLGVARAQVYPAGTAVPPTMYLDLEGAHGFVFAELRRSEAARAGERFTLGRPVDQAGAIPPSAGAATEALPDADAEVERR